MEFWLFLALAAIIIYCTIYVVARLPKHIQPVSLRYDPPDEYVSFEIYLVSEEDFEIVFVDDWQCGRKFSLHGFVKSNDGQDDKYDSIFGERIHLSIGQREDWFQSCHIGLITEHKKGQPSCYVAFPYQIARHILEDVRRSPKQLVTLGFKREAGGPNKCHRILSFVMTDLSD